MSDWAETNLGDLIDIKHGFAFKGQYFSDTPPGDILLTPGNFAIGGGFQFNKLKYYDGPNEPEYTLRGGELLVTMTDLSKAGDTLGYPAIVPVETRTFLHNQRLGRVVMKSDDVGQDFIYWLMRTPAYRNEVLSSYTGSTVKHTSPKRIQTFRCKMPPKEEREAIVASLSTLDDKIELNRRMNETLEEMARAMFRDWFVDFGPTRRQMEGATDPTAIMGHAFPPEKAATLAPLFPTKLSYDGLPEGWKNGRLDDWATSSPQTVKPSEVDPDTNYIGLEHMPRRSIALGDWETAEKVTSNKARFIKGQVLFGKLRPYFHKVGIAPVDGICSTDIVVVDGLSKSLVPFVATLMSSDEFVAYTNQSSTGTKMPRTSWKLMRDYRVARPPVAIVEAFGAVVQPMHETIMHSLGENNTLADMRDLLLPKLMSGEIRLTEAVDG